MQQSVKRAETKYCKSAALQASFTRWNGVSQRETPFKIGYHISMNVLPGESVKEVILEFESLDEFESFFDEADRKGSFDIPDSSVQYGAVFRARVLGSPRTRKIKPVKVVPKGEKSTVFLTLKPPEKTAEKGVTLQPVQEESAEMDIGSQPEVAKSQFEKIRALTVSERVTLAMKADLMERRILMQENNSKVNEFLLRNVRITEQEIAFMVRNAGVPMQNLLMIAGNRAWMNHEPIRAAVLMNPRTPAAMVMDMIPTLSPPDLLKMNNAPYLREDVKSAVRRELKKRGIKVRENL